MSTCESAAVAREMTEALVRDHPDLCGLFISGGEITGALAAMHDHPRERDFVAVGSDLFDAARAALIAGTLTMAISHPMQALPRAAISTMIRAKQAGPESGTQTTLLGFEIYT